MKTSCNPVPRFELDSYDWNERHLFCCEQAENKKADIIFIGDSITHFWDSAAVPNSHGGPVWDKYFSTKNVLNIGFGWDRTPNVLWRLEHGHFKNQTPKFVVLNIGTNNFAQTESYPGDTPEDVADGVSAVIKKLHQLSPETVIVSMAVFPRGDRGNELEEKVFKLNMILNEKFKRRKNVIRLDLTDNFMTQEGKQIKVFFRDGCHLSYAGYEVWAQALMPIIEQ